ncbi:hypothetical protein Q8W16_21960 [Photobacterium damselae subsp. piscicida]|nr:hypothetical protein [Photobacterium damselae subsp. piscicida]
MLMVSAVKAATLDLLHQEGYEYSTINIEELPDVDPWSKEGMALAKFEQLRDAAIEAADAEREALNAIWKLKKKMRAEALSRGDSGYELGDLPQEMHDELEQLTDAAMSAKDAKLAASEQAQEARVAFNDIMKQKILAEAQEQTA